MPRISNRYVDEDREILDIVQNSDGLTAQQLTEFKTKLAQRYGPGSYRDCGRASTVPAHTCQFITTNGSWVVLPASKRDLPAIWQRVQFASRFAQDKPSITVVTDWTDDAMPPWYEVAKKGDGDVLNALSGDGSPELAKRLTDFQGGDLMRGELFMTPADAKRRYPTIDFSGTAILSMQLYLDHIAHYSEKLRQSEREARQANIERLRARGANLFSNPDLPVTRVVQDGRLTNYIDYVDAAGTRRIGLTDQGWKRKLLEARFRDQSEAVGKDEIHTIRQNEYNSGFFNRTQTLLEQWRGFVTRSFYGMPHVTLGAAFQSARFRNPRTHDGALSHLDRVYSRFLETGEWTFTDAAADAFRTTNTAGLWDPRTSKFMFNLGRLMVSTIEEIIDGGSSSAHDQSIGIISEMLV